MTDPPGTSRPSAGGPRPDEAPHGDTAPDDTAEHDVETTAAVLRVTPLAQARRLVWQPETSPMTLLQPAAPTRGAYKRKRQFRIRQEEQLHEAVDVALRLGAVLLSGGARTDDVEAAIFAAGTALGLEGFDVDITYTAMTLSVPPRDGRPGTTALRVVRRRAMHHSRLAAAHDLVVDLAAGRVTREALVERLDAIERLPRPFPRWFVTLAWGVLAAALVVRLGGGLLTALVALVSASAVDRVGRVLARHGAPRFFLNATGAIIATAVAVGLTAAAGDHVEPGLVVAGGIIALLPGMALVVAAQEAMGSFPVTAAARLVELTVATAGVVAGVLGGLVLATLLGVPMSVSSLSTASLGEVVVVVLAGAVAAAASAVGSHAPPRVLVPAGLTGLAGMAALVLVAESVATPGAAEAVAGTVVGVMGGLIALRRGLPTVLVVVPGIIPMLPGLASYQGLLALSQGDVPAGTAYLLGALTVAVSLAAGVLLGELVATAVARRRRWGAGADAATASASGTGPGTAVHLPTTALAGVATGVGAASTMAGGGSRRTPRRRSGAGSGDAGPGDAGPAPAGGPRGAPRPGRQDGGVPVRRPILPPDRRPH